MDIQACTESLRTKVGVSSGLNATLKFDCGADGVIFVDGKSVPNSVRNENMDADCIIAITLENLAEMLQGKLDPTAAFMTGKLKVTGDMGVALKLRNVL